MGNLIVTGVTFGVFMTEALIHYNLGVAESEGEFRLRLPPSRELAKIAAVTAVFSVASTLIVRALPKHLAPRI